MRPDNEIFTSYANQIESFSITPELVDKYDLKSWSVGFKLGTAGYRDLLEPHDFFSPDVP